VKTLLTAVVLAAIIAITAPSAGACTHHGLGYRPEPVRIGKSLPFRGPVLAAGNLAAYGGINPYWRVGR